MRIKRLAPALAALLLAVTASWLPQCHGALGEAWKRDWTESPLIGQGNPPAGVTTDVYLSVYVERLLEVNEKDYSFTASLLFTLSWKDPRAQGAVAAATAAAQQPGGSCARLCSYSDELAPTTAQCCGGDLWLPSLRFRNMMSMSGGRDAVFWINVRPDNVVVWRVKVQAQFFTNLIFKAFPFDTNSLDIHLMSTNATTGRGTPGTDVKYIASATGDRVFELGEGSDSNGWNIETLLVWQSRHSWADQFTPKYNFRRSARADPAPVLPALNDSLVLTPFGSDIEVTDITASIIVKRQSATYVMNTIVPVIVVTTLALLTFLLGADMISTRLSCAQTMFLTLVAVSWVSEGFTPKASYPVPTRVLLCLSYAVLVTIALETIAVMALRNGVSIGERARRVRAGRNEHVAAMLSNLRLRKKKKQDDDGLPTASNGGVAISGGAGAGGGAPVIAAKDAAPPADADAASKARDNRVSFYEWMAELLDLVTFVGLALFYAVSAALIFVFAKAKQPDYCAMSGAPKFCMDQLGRA